MGANSSLHENDGCRRSTDHIPISKQDARVHLPHNVECIIGDADVQVDRSSAHRMYGQLRAGVFLNNKRKKYWVDQATNNCFIVYARHLSITWSEDGRFWQWLSEKDMSSEELVDVVKLENVCWLEVNGTFEVSKLSPNVVYEVAFIVKIVAESAYGWEVPVNFRLRLPNGSKQESKINLTEKPRGQWIKVPAGQFETSTELKGEIEYSLYEYEGGKWKRGLMIMGVSIQPKHL